MLDVPEALALIALALADNGGSFRLPDPRLAVVPFRLSKDIVGCLPTSPCSFSGTRQTPSTTRPQELETLLADLLGEHVAADQPLMEAGLDSIGAVELRNAVAAKFGVDLPATATFDFPTLGALAAHVTGRQGGGAPAQGRPAAQGLQHGRVSEEESAAAWMQRATEARPRRPWRRPRAACVHGNAARASRLGPSTSLWSPCTPCIPAVVWNW